MSAIIKHEESLALNEIMTLGDVFRQSGYFQDVRDQSQAVVKILFGRELGFSPVISMTGIHIIEGKPALSSNLMATLIKRSGRYDYRVKTWTNTECELTFREKVDGKWEDIGLASFTIEDAKTAGIAFKSRQGFPTSWAKFPKAMLFARALSQGLRAYCPDVSAAPIYNPEEMGAEVNEEGEVIDAPVQAKPAEPKKPISFKRESAAANKGQDEQDNIMQKGSPEPTSQAAEVHAEVVESVPAPASAVEYIARKEQREFHAACRDAARDRNKADEHTYQWLIDNGYVKTDGEPSSSMIPVKDWPKAKQMAEKWISVQ